MAFLGVSEFKHMLFGLHGVAAMFQRLINWVVAPHQQYAAAYIDDIIIYTNDWDYHLKALRVVLQELQLASLTAKPGKHMLRKAKTKYLGFLV